MFSEFIMITLLASYQVSLVSSVPRLLVNNTGSDATGTDVYPQPGAPLEVWCWTEKNESNSRRWYDPSDTWLQSTDTESTDEDVYVLNAPGGRYVKILKFSSYSHSQAGRYYCGIKLINVDSGPIVNHSIYIGTPPKVEGVTVMVSGSATSPMISVSWTAVNSTTSVAYTVYYSNSTQPPPGSGSSVQNITGTSLTLTSSHGLQTGITYYIWVSALATSGQLEGPISDRESAGLYVAPVPESVSVVPTPSEGTLRVTWTRPTVSDGSTITSYSIPYKRSNAMTYSSNLKTVNGGNTTSSDITGLDLSTQYSVRIASVNELGTGYYSGIVRATTYGYASTPSNVRASPVPKSGKVRVSWTAPSPPTGSSLTGYFIQYRMGDSGSYMIVRVPGRSATRIIVRNLQVGTQYQVRVAVETELGVGPNSYGTTQVTTFNVPDQVPSLAVLPSKSSNGLISLTVTWGEPHSDVDITVYNGNYRMLPSGNWSKDFFQATTNRECVHRNLMSGVNYEVRVRALSPIGPGEYRTATTSSPTTPVVQTSTTTTSLYLQWTSSGGDTFTLYYWKNSTPSDVSTVNTTSLSYNITGLDSNTAYKVIVSARNVLGSSNSSEVKGCTIPEAPIQFTLAPLSSTSINVQWSPPPNSDRLPLTYHVNYTRMSRSTSDTTLTLTGLHPYEEYTISVQAGNKGGLSVPVTGTARTYSDRPLSHPIMGRANPGHRWCVLKWNIPEETGRNGVIQKYIIELQQTEDNKWNITHELPTYNFSSPASISYNLTNLTPQTTYKWRVAAATVNGTGPFTPDPLGFKTLEGVPGPVSSITYNVTNTSVVISWKEPDESNGVIKGYMLYYYKTVRNMEGNITNMKVTKKIPVNEFNITLELDPYIPYKVTITANTSVGEGEPSSIIVFFTSRDEKISTNETVGNLTAVWKDSDALVSWIPLSVPTAKEFPLYRVSYSSNSGSRSESVNTTNSSVTISGLDSQVEYTFTVQVIAGNGYIISQPKQVILQPLTKTDTSSMSVDVLDIAPAVGIGILVLVVAIITAIVIGLVVRRQQKKKTARSAAIQVQYKPDIQTNPLSIDNPIDADDRSIVYLPVEMSIDDGRNIPRSRFLEVTNQLHTDRDKGFEEEFKTITNDPNGSDVIAKANKHKNRYGNIYTYDHSRVVLSVPDGTGNDYINASFIDGYKRQNAYIAAQGPTKTTVSDFWQMIWDQKCPVIVMLTNIEENGRRKCKRYWNEDMDHSLEPGRDFSVRVTSNMGYANYVIREITLINASSTHCEPLKVKHFHFTTWPDFGVPTHPSSLVKFVQHVRKEYKDSTAPVVVHCSAGVGRTGTFITIDAMMERLKEKDNLNIYQFVTEMRSSRTFMVQTMDQYAFIHDALCDYLTCGDTSIPAHQLKEEIEDMDEVDNDTRMSGFESQFKLLESVSKKPASTDETFSRKSVVGKKNRYKDRFPYSNNYLHISGKGTTIGGDYFNASFVDSYKRRKAFIAAQAPLENTRNDVWEMIWQLRPSTIVLLCDFKEGKEVTCLQFWPEENIKVLDFGFLKVNHKGTIGNDAGYDIITLEVFNKRKESGGVWNVNLYHLKNWFKNGQPPLEAILRLMGDVENAMTSTTGDSQAMVMCDDGMGRSGVFICAMSEVERVKVEGQVDVFQTIKGMRIQRPHMVDTPDQYKLCFDILQSYLDSFDTYANFKTV